MGWEASRWPGCSIPRFLDGGPGGRYGQARGSLARGSQPAASARQGKAGDPSLHGRRTVAVRELRLQAPAQGTAWQAIPGVVHQGPAARAIAKHGAQGAGAVVRLPQARAVGPGDLRPVPAYRRHRRPDLHRAVDDDGADQPRPCACLHEHGIDHQGAAEHGLLAAVRAGGRDRRPARFHRLHLGRRQRAAAGVGAPVVGGNLAQQVSGHPVPVPGRRRPLHRQSARNRSESRSG